MGAPPVFDTGARLGRRGGPARRTHEMGEKPRGYYYGLAIGTTDAGRRSPCMLFVGRLVAHMQHRGRHRSRRLAVVADRPDSRAQSVKHAQYIEVFSHLGRETFPIAPTIVEEVLQAHPTG